MNLDVGPDFTGAIHVTIDGDVVHASAHGLADRSAGIANTLDTRFGIASGTKFLTALTARSLIADGVLRLDDRLVDVVSLPLPGVSPAVTIEHLLTHTSGVYDYLDEDEIPDDAAFEMSIPPYKLLGPRDYLPMLCAGPAKFEPGARACYSNGGYVLLGLALEEATGRSYHALVEERVLRPHGMTDSGFFRFDRVPPRCAQGYVDEPDGGWRTNIYALPIIGGPDGGMFATVGDIARLWRGLGYPAEKMSGGDVGVSFRSTCYAPGTVATVVSNRSGGASQLYETINEYILRLT